jgi:hypothetical protein
MLTRLRRTQTQSRRAGRACGEVAPKGYHRKIKLRAKARCVPRKMRASGGPEAPTYR